MPLYEGMSLGSDKHSVVIEIGNAYTRCGFVHEYSPRAIIKSEIFILKFNKTMNLYDITDDDDLYSALKEFIQLLYFRYLAVNPKDRRVVNVESLFCPSRFRRYLAKVLFTHFDIQGLLIVPQHLVSLTTLGISSALILDIGYKEALSIPVIEGVTVLDALQYAPLGGKSIHYRIMDELLRRRAIIKENDTETVITEPLNENLLEDIKVRTCFVAPFEKGIEMAKQKIIDFSDDVSAEPPHVKYPIDGDKILHIPGSLRQSVCEVMFEMYGDEHTIPTLIIDAILKSPVDCRKLLAENIVIIGGTSMIPGFKHRLLMELKSLSQSDRFKSKVHFNTFKFHKLICKENYASWLGGSIFGSTEVLSTRSVTREQYSRNNQNISDWSDWVPTKG